MHQLQTFPVANDDKILQIFFRALFCFMRVKQQTNKLAWTKNHKLVYLRKFYYYFFLLAQVADYKQQVELRVGNCQ